jgi:hypothetical protein
MATLEPSNNHLLGVSSSYAAWLYDSIDRGLRRTIQKTANWGDPIDYLIQRSSISKYSRNSRDEQGYAFRHGDLNAHNILVDAHGHLEGYATAKI